MEGMEIFCHPHPLQDPVSVLPHLCAAQGLGFGG